ncbi:MAG: hypothetical protein JO110_04575 [Acetobacteraceae bacterium]|jgi:hypothetical protein|nr:hypothetical protein [Acetobacteraceae bacterium]
MVRKTLIAAAVALIPLTSMGVVEKAHAGYFIYQPTCHYFYNGYTGILWRVCR